MKRVARAAALCVLILALAGIIGWTLIVRDIRSAERAHGDGCLPVAESATSLPGTEALRRVITSHDDTGFQVAVADRTGAVTVITTGPANRAAGCPVTRDHLFLVGSVSKLVTATLILQLLDEGRLSLDDRAGALVGVPIDPGITLRDLLGHRSGLPDYTGGLGFLLRFAFLPDAEWDPRQLATDTAARPLLFTPGEAYAYANVNFVLLGLIVEATTGVSFAEAVATRLAEPYGLDTLHHGGPSTPHRRVAHGIDHDILPFGPRDMTGFRASHLQSAFAAGGIVSDAADLARFGQALFTGGIVTPESLGLMMAAPAVTDPNAPRTVGYGLGVRRMRTASGAVTWGHTGTIPGYAAFLEHDPISGQTLAILANRSLVDLGGLADRVWEALREAR